VVALDSARSWFRYHRLFAGLLQLELRRTAPGEVTGLHAAAAGWFAGHGFAVEAVHHAQAARDWGLAARLLADHWPGLYLGGQVATVHELLAGFPAEARAADAELAALAAADELAQGSLEEAKRYLTLAALGSVSVPAARGGRVQVLLGVVGLLLARQRGNPPAVAEEARRLQAAAEAPDAARAGLGEDLRAQHDTPERQEKRDPVHAVGGDVVVGCVPRAHAAQAVGGDPADPLAEPLQAEHEQQGARDDSQAVDGQVRQRRAERQDERRDDGQAGAGAQQGRAPAVDGADADHDDHHLDDLDGCGEERCGEDCGVDHGDVSP
jgi:hypothetical protein